MKFANFLPFFHSIKFPFQSNFVPQWSKMIPTKVGEDWSRNKKVMAILLCTNMIFANFRPFIQDFDHFSIPSNLHFGQILFLDGQRWFLSNLAKIGHETKKLWRFYCALTWNLSIFDHLSMISIIFPFDQILISIKFCSSMVKDDSYQIWRRLVMKQKSYCDFTVL